MKLAGRPVAAFDPDGLIFAAGINSESVKLYDLRWDLKEGHVWDWVLTDIPSPWPGPLTKVPSLPSNFKPTAKKLSGLGSSSLQMAR